MIKELIKRIAALEQQGEDHTYIVPLPDGREVTVTLEEILSVMRSLRENKNPKLIELFRNTTERSGLVGMCRALVLSDDLYRPKDIQEMFYND